MPPTCQGELRPVVRCNSTKLRVADALSRTSRIVAVLPAPLGPRNPKVVAVVFGEIPKLKNTQAIYGAETLSAS